MISATSSIHSSSFWCLLKKLLASVLAWAMSISWPRKLNSATSIRAAKKPMISTASISGHTCFR